MSDNRELIELQARTLFVHDPNSRLLFVNEPDSKPPAPRFFLGRTREGNIWRFRVDLPRNITIELEQLCVDEPVSRDLESEPKHFHEYLSLLETHIPVISIESGPVYIFTEFPEPAREVVALSTVDVRTLDGGFEKLVEELPAWQPFLGIVEKGRAVSVCRSVRIAPDAHEAGVETLPDFRGNGYAVDVTGAWARVVTSAGAIPFYSTSWENAASQAVARKLGLTLFGSDFHIV